MCALLPFNKSFPSSLLKSIDFSGQTPKSLDLSPLHVLMDLITLSIVEVKFFWTRVYINGSQSAWCHISSSFLIFPRWLLSDSFFVIPAVYSVQQSLKCNCDVFPPFPSALPRAHITLRERTQGLKCWKMNSGLFPLLPWLRQKPFVSCIYFMIRKLNLSPPGGGLQKGALFAPTLQYQ